jgi:hypothetical protein
VGAARNERHVVPGLRQGRPERPADPSAPITAIRIVTFLPSSAFAKTVIRRVLPKLEWSFGGSL